MSRVWRSLRVRLAVLGFLAIYVPALLLFGVILVTDSETRQETVDGVQVVDDTSQHRSPWVTWTVVALAPVAAGSAWWWAGRAVRPYEQMYHRLEHAADTQRRLIEETSHELRIPLSVLATNAEVLLAHPDPTLESYRQGLERSGRAATRLQEIIDVLLVDARGRARTIDRRPADLMALVRAVADEVAPLAATREIELAITGPAAAVCPIDEATVQRAVANLVDNAVRYSPDASSVEIAVDLDNHHAGVVVTDHGPGIPSDEQEHIFERFWRGRRGVHGTGLGLPIAAQIATAHGGRLTVTSPGPDGDGCVFRLTLRR